MAGVRRGAGRSAVALCLVAAACTGGGGGSATPPPGAPTLREMAADLGSQVVERLIRGYVPGRSGEVVLVTRPWDTVAQWPGGLRGPEDPRTTHAAPWAYLERVPIVLYGPGFIRGGVVSDRAVEVTDLAATFADLLAFAFDAPDGRPLGEALLPAGERPGRPRLLVLVVYDGGGWNVLERWPEAWPTARRLAREGTAYTNATVGSAPPVTAPVHANMGTGAYPRAHGLPENTVRLPDGSVGEIYFHEGDPQLLLRETVADAWDRRHGNRPWVGLLGYDAWHLGMMGSGGRLPGADRDVAVLWDREAEAFWANESFYRVPDYLPGRESLDRRLAELDAADGADGRWMGNDLADPLLVPGTPAFVAHQGDALLEMVRREPIGGDGLTDLLFVEMKATDTAGHLWNMTGPEFGEVLEAQDRVLGELVRALDERVGPGGYVLALTADHGQVPSPATTGGLRIDRFRVLEAVNAHFGADVVEAVHPDDVYLREEVLRGEGITVEAVARVLGSLRYEQVAPEGTDPDALPPEVRDRRVFAAALPGSFLLGLTEAEVRGLGDGAYPEGDLTSATAAARFARLLR